MIKGMQPMAPSVDKNYILKNCISLPSLQNLMINNVLLIICNIFWLKRCCSGVFNRNKNLKLISSTRALFTKQLM